MLALENADEILQILDRFTKQKSKDIPPELEEYINYVAKTGDTVYRWNTIKYLFREKLRNVIKDFHDTTASIEDLPQCPNVDQFNYESMKTLLFERFDNFQAAPFTIQRLCELLTDPKKHYSRLDKFMRALEKNILVVSTVEPGRKPVETEPDFASFIDQPGINDLKKSISEQNDSLHVKHIGNGKHNDSNDPSSSTQADTDIKKKEEKMDEDAVPEKLKEADEKVVKAESKIEKDVDITIKKEEPVESKPAESKPAESKPVEPKPANSDEKPPTATDSEEKNVAKPDVTESIETAEKTEKTEKTEKIEKIEKTEKKENGQVDVEIKVTSAEEKTTEPLDEKKDDEKDAKEAPAAVPPVEIEKASTPKRRSSGDDEDEDIDAESISNPSAKKIRLDLKEDEKEPVKADSEEPTNEPVVPEPDLSKETDILESISTEIDAQKESELLDDVVDSTLAVEKGPISSSVDSSDVKPAADDKVAESEAAKPVEETPATDELKVEAPTASIPSDLDFTPDEALNELVSSDILSAIPEQPAVEEVKMSDETATVPEPVAAPPAADAMNVENAESTENSAPELENAMEAAPIKTDEEQMDVDESNSVDAMDL